MDQRQGAILRIAISGILLMGGAMFVGAAEAGYCTIDGCVVTPPPAPDGSSGGGGGWGGNSTEGQTCGGNSCPPDNMDEEDRCDYLAMTRPPSCPSPIPYPSGHAWPKNIVPSGSGIAKAIYFVDHQSGVYASPRQIARSALETLVHRLADQLTNVDGAIYSFGVAFRKSCEEQSKLLSGVRARGIITASERQCSGALDKILAEGDGQQPSSAGSSSGRNSTASYCRILASHKPWSTGLIPPIQ